MFEIQERWQVWPMSFRRSPLDWDGPALPKTLKLGAEYDATVNLRPVYPPAVRVAQREKIRSAFHRVAGGGRPPPAPTERGVRISRTTLFGSWFTAFTAICSSFVSMVG
jgi:hypothetical protein